jgi:DNA-directed RNA polymerase subunit RPC12/RpoP
MQVKVTCPNCGKELKAPEELRGKRVACPSCNESFRVGGPAEPPPGLPGSGPLRGVPPPVNRPAQAAKFIADESVETRVRFGADGRLPELRFEARTAEPDPQQTQVRDSNPLLLVGVLCFSITLSLILLVFEPQEFRSSDAAKAEARHWIELKYIGVGPNLKPHEKRLREALQAFYRGDRGAERRLYRDVLNMLHDESHQGAAGLTGPRAALDPPNDQHLEQQLATLLSGD